LAGCPVISRVRYIPAADTDILRLQQDFHLVYTMPFAVLRKPVLGSGRTVFIQLRFVIKNTT
jgi:hypothetical protein